MARSVPRAVSMAGVDKKKPDSPDLVVKRQALDIAEDFYRLSGDRTSSKRV